MVTGGRTPNGVGGGSTRGVAPDHFGRPRPDRAAGRGAAPAGEGPDPRADRHVRLPGLPDSLPFLVVASVLIAYGTYLLVSHSPARVALIPLYLPTLAVGTVLFVGGIVGAMVDDDRGVPSEDPARTAASPSTPETFTIPREEWFALKAQLEVLQTSRAERAAQIEAAPWDEGPHRSPVDVPARPGGSTDDTEARYTFEELESIEHEIAPRRRTDVRPGS